MFGLPENELILYGGIVIMALAALLALICIVVFVVSGARLKSRLEEDYGKLQQYNRNRKQ